MLKDVKTEQVDGTIEIDEWVFGENKMASDDPWDEIIDGYVRLKLNYKLHLENETATSTSPAASNSTRATPRSWTL
jgi:hypothetical protein